MKAILKFLAKRPKAVAAFIALLLAIAGVESNVINPTVISDDVNTWIQDNVQDEVPAAADAGVDAE